MALNHPSQGINYVPAYQTPGLPWVTGSYANGITRHDFPKVSQLIIVKNNGSSSLGFAFTYNGFSSNHSVTLSPTESFSLETRIKSLFISGAIGTPYNVVAALTTIESRCMPALTGSTSPSSGSATWEGIG